MRINPFRCKPFRLRPAGRVLSSALRPPEEAEETPFSPLPAQADRHIIIPQNSTGEAWIENREAGVGERKMVTTGRCCFVPLLFAGVRSKYVERAREGTNLVLLASGVVRTFPSVKSANEALRLVLRLTRLRSEAGRSSRRD